MPTLTQPGFLLAGALLAVVPVVLHFLARRPPGRVPLPTVRFLRPDVRSRLGLRSRPDHLLLLALRVVLLLLLGLAFARPVWAPERNGTLRIVLLDQGEAVEGVWREVVEAAVTATHAEGARESLLVVAGAPTVRSAATSGGAGVEHGGADERAPHTLTREVLTPARIDSLRAAGPSGARFLYLDALHAARQVAEAAVGFDSVEVRMVTRPRWEAWSPGVHPLRPALWPGRLGITEIRSDPGSTAGAAVEGEGGATPDATPVRVHAGAGEGRFVRAALRALGREVTAVAHADGAPEDAAGTGSRDVAPSDPEADADSGRDPVPDRGAAAGSGGDDAPRQGTGRLVHVLVGPLPAGTLEGILTEALEDARTRGDTVVLAGIPLEEVPALLRAVLPWRAGDDAPGRAAGGDASAAAEARAGNDDGAAILLRADGVPIGGVRSLGGVPASGARVPVLRADGRAAAAAASWGGGCVVWLAARPEAGQLPESTRFPELFAALLGGCAPQEPFAGGVATYGEGVGVDGTLRAVDPGPEAMALLRGDHLPTRVATTALGEASGAGHPLVRWLLVAALLVALLEAVLVYGPAKGRQP